VRFYDMEFDEQYEELDNMWWTLFNMTSDICKDNPYYDEILDLMNRIHDKKTETKNKIPQDNTNEYLTAEYWRNQL